MIEDNPEFVKESNLPTGTDCGRARGPGFHPGLGSHALSGRRSQAGPAPRPNGPADLQPRVKPWEPSNIVFVSRAAVARPSTFREGSGLCRNSMIDRRRPSGTSDGPPQPVDAGLANALPPGPTTVAVIPGPDLVARPCGRRRRGARRLRHRGGCSQTLPADFLRICPRRLPGIGLSGPDRDRAPVEDFPRSVGDDGVWRAGPGPGPGPGSGRGPGSEVAARGDRGRGYRPGPGRGRGHAGRPRAPLCPSITPPAQGSASDEDHHNDLALALRTHGGIWTGRRGRRRAGPRRRARRRGARCGPSHRSGAA